MAPPSVEVDSSFGKAMTVQREGGAQAGLGGLGGAVLEGSLVAGINFGAGSLGTLAESYIATGGPPSAKDYLLGGLLGVVSGRNRERVLAPERRDLR